MGADERLARGPLPTAAEKPDPLVNGLGEGPGPVHNGIVTRHPPLDWLEDLFADVGFRARPGVLWSVDSRELPITVTLKAGEEALGALVLDGPDLIDAVCTFAAELQEMLQPDLRVGVPPCPAHARILVPRRIPDRIEWQCPEGDFTCNLGEYQEALWPPGPEERDAAPLLASRLSRRGLKWSTLEMTSKDGAWVPTITLQVDTDERAVRAAVAPLVAELHRTSPAYTVREDHAGTSGKSPYRSLSLEGTPRLLALLRGALRRAPEGDSCDFLVEGTPGHHIRVRLAPEHSVGAVGDCVIRDASGEPFADDGDSVECVGGGAPGSRVEGDPPYWYAWELRVIQKSELD